MNGRSFSVRGPQPRDGDTDNMRPPKRSQGGRIDPQPRDPPTGGRSFCFALKAPDGVQLNGPQPRDPGKKRLLHKVLGRWF